MAGGVIDLPLGFQLAPIVQYSSPPVLAQNTGFDIDGDGLANVDRICAGTNPEAVFAVRGNPTAIRALNPLGCTQAGSTEQRGGFVVNPNGKVEERSGRYLNVDLRVTKSFGIGRRARFKVYADIYNLFDMENLYFKQRNPRAACASGGEDVHAGARCTARASVRRWAARSPPSSARGSSSSLHRKR